MQQRDYEITFKNVDEFKKATGEVWISLEENIIDRNTHVAPSNTVLACVHINMSTSPALSGYPLCFSMTWLIEALLVQVEC